MAFEFFFLPIYYTEIIFWPPLYLFFIQQLDGMVFSKYRVHLIHHSNVQWLPAALGVKSHLLVNSGMS